MQDKSTKLVHKAIDYSDREKYSKALKYLLKAININPNNAQAFFERGVVLVNQDRDSEAVADFTRALELQSNFPGAFQWRAKAYFSQGELELAAEDLLADLKCNLIEAKGMGISPQSWAKCAEAYEKIGNNSLAMDILLEYFSKYESNVTYRRSEETSPMRLIAKFYMDAGNFESATKFAELAYNSKHKCPADLLTYALTLEKNSDLEKARKICDEAIQANAQMSGVQELKERLNLNI